MYSFPTSLSFCVVGPIQAHGKADHIEPQGYRKEISRLVRDVFPDCSEFCPDERVRRLASRIVKDSEQGKAASEQDIKIIVSEFLLATKKVGDCDLVVGYLPDGILSMGMAMELYAAHLSGAYTVLLSTNTENLALLSTVNVFVPDLTSLEQHLRKLSPSYDG